MLLSISRYLFEISIMVRFCFVQQNKQTIFFVANMEAFLSYVMDNSNNLVDQVRKNTDKILEIETDERLGKYQIVALSLGGDEVTLDYEHNFDSILHIAKGTASVLRRPQTGSEGVVTLKEGESFVIPRDTVYMVRNSDMDDDLKVLAVYSGVAFPVIQEQCPNLPPDQVLESESGSESAEMESVHAQKKQKPARGSSVPSRKPPPEDRRRSRGDGREQLLIPDTSDEYDETLRNEVLGNVEFLGMPNPRVFDKKLNEIVTDLQTLSRSLDETVEMRFFSDSNRGNIVARIFATYKNSEKKFFCGQCRFSATDAAVVCLETAYIMEAFRGSPRSLCCTMIYYALQKCLLNKYFSLGSRLKIPDERSSAKDEITPDLEQVHVLLSSRTPVAAYLCYKKAIEKNNFELVQKPRGNPQLPRVKKGKYQIAALKDSEEDATKAFVDKNDQDKTIGDKGREEGRMVHFNAASKNYEIITLSDYMTWTKEEREKYPWTEPLVFIKRASTNKSYVQMEKGDRFINRSTVMDSAIEWYLEKLRLAYMSTPELVFDPAKSTAEERAKKSEAGFFWLPQWLYRIKDLDMNKEYEKRTK